MSHNSTEPVVAAIDATPGSERALAWATDQALLTHRGLRIVYAFEWPLHHTIPRDLPGFDIDELPRRLVAAAADEVRRRAPELTVEAVHITGGVAPTLLLEAENAHTVVVGSRGLHGLQAVLLGSTGLELAARAACPVTVVTREPRSATGRVVVGVDGSDTAQVAAAWGFTEASARGATVHAVTAYDHASHGVFRTLETPPPGFSGVPERGAALEEARRHLSESLAGQRELHPDVAVREKAVSGHPAEVLAAESEKADLLVVGSHGRGGFGGMLLGSISQSVLSHARCPVMVVHAGDRS
ncbi:universal stress protein [Nocardiopsis ansamitocini]|uniref:universal stress protein n=1 Tax=Nocardiopsis ansamitocini TaxID=1670832 RepID=UPI0025566308|nr:universal stress protein [Nocardiopsis ansamitocini]